MRTGFVVCWGDIPAPPSGEFKDIAAGGKHACGIRIDGTLACWGVINPPPAGTFVSLSAGEYHACAVRTDDAVLCWGGNGYGQAVSPEPPILFRKDPFAFSGFQAPIQDLPALNRVVAGSVVPLQFSLDGDRGVDVFAVGYPKSYLVECSTGAPLGQTQATTGPGQGDLQYRSQSDMYTYRWKTDHAWSGCRQLIVRFRDGSTHELRFDFRKAGDS
jgi:hypothetical protein